jgi:L-ascorbate metabolism protein UlaG (beta-lactamase superfamily)
VRVTHVGTATVLLEIGGLRILTDPALDPAGRRYSFGWGLGSFKSEAPALPPGGLGKVDAILLSHDHHADNFDDAGREFAKSVARVVTTVSGARRVGSNAIGLAPWSSTEIKASDGTSVRVTATPARHGPPGVTLVEWETIGFLLEWAEHTVYISGDTVFFGGIEEVAKRAKVGLALLHLGGVAFGLTGPIKYTFTGAAAAKAAQALGCKTIVPVHYDGWEHFRESRAESERAFEAAGLTPRVRWLKKGEPTEVAL